MSARRIYLFAGLVPDKEAVAVSQRYQVQVPPGGSAIWRRLDDRTARCVAAGSADLKIPCWLRRSLGWRRRITYAAGYQEG